MRIPDTRYYVMLGSIIVGLRDTAEEAEALVLVCEQRGMRATVVGPSGDGWQAGAPPPPGPQRA